MVPAYVTVVLALLPLCVVQGHLPTKTGQTRDEEITINTNGRNIVCYYTPTSYFPASKIPGDLCTHLVYAFGNVQGLPQPGITPPTSGVASIWRTMTSLKSKNPQLKVILSLQKNFSTVVGPDNVKMQKFADNSVAYLRRYQFDGVDMDWEYPSSSQKYYFANFFKTMRDAIANEARRSGKPALLLSLALPNNQVVASRSYDLPTIAKAVDFATAMTYDFHVFNKADTNTGYNSPLYTPLKEYKYLSTAAMIQYYLSAGFPARKLLMGIPTYGRSWKLRDASQHGLHAPAVGKGDKGPYRHLTGIYTYPDVCTALKQGATSVSDATVGAVYLYKDNTWVAYDDPTTITNKCSYVKKTGLAGVGVWALHIDDVGEVCGAGPLPLINTMKNSLIQSTPEDQETTHNGPESENKKSAVAMDRLSLLEAVEFDRFQEQSVDTKSKYVNGHSDAVFIMNMMMKSHKNV